MKFEIVVPAYNEEAIISETVSTLNVILSKIQKIPFEIIVADNGSTDQTKEKVLGLGLSSVRVLEIAGKGKGLALRTVAQNSKADLFGFIDADLSADPSCISPMLEILLNDEADIVIGSRLLDKDKVNRSLWRTATSEIFNYLRLSILGINVRDSQCGLKLINRKGIDIFSRCTENTWFFDLELLALAQRRGLTVKEIPVGWEEFRYKGRASKLNVIRDGINSIIAMFRIRARINKENKSL